MPNNPMIKQVLIFALLTGMLVPQAASADTTDTSVVERLGYNMELITFGIDRYWKDTGHMPDSLSELYAANLVPLNLLHPVTGEPLSFDGRLIAPGDIALEKTDDQTVILSFIMYDGKEMSLTIDSARYTPYTPTRLEGPDRRMSLYLGWASYALNQYYTEFEVVPGSIDDLSDAGYWPFDGQENAFTGEPLAFFNREPGDLLFRFEQDEAWVIAHFSGNVVSAYSVPGERTYY